MAVQISPEAMADAKASVTTAGNDHQTAAKYPDVTLTDAPTAQSALDDLGVAWGNRLDRDDALAEAVGTAFTLVGTALRSVDSEMTAYLDGIGYSWSNDQ